MNDKANGTTPQHRTAKHARSQVNTRNLQLELQVAQRTRDLSEANQRLRLRQQELERANAELERLDDLKSEFVSLVSHELRAPLANISGSLQLLLIEDETNSLSQHQREMITLANEETERLIRLVKGVLNVARIEAGETPFSLQALDIVALLHCLIEQWQTCDPNHRWIGPRAQNLPSVWGDRDRIEQVLMNLFDNAYKYSKADGTIRVNVELLEEGLVVSIRDEGKGIPGQELESIFKKFHRVERTDARETYGYGLGLYIARKLVNAMGGDLWAESRVGEGSCFFFSLPLAGAQDIAPQSP